MLTDAGRHAFPSPAEAPALMRDFATWLGGAADDPATAFAAHRRLVDIHPFNDGNGRTARLQAALDEALGALRQALPAPCG